MTPEVPSSGRLRNVRLPHILIFLQRQKKTGVLTLRRNDQEKSVYLRDGDIIFSISRYPDDRLGEVLLKAGKINLHHYLRSLELMKTTGMRQGAILVDQGFIKPKDLVWAVTRQVREIILSLFTWVDGEYRFQEGPFPTEEVITLKMSTGNLILEGTKRINDWTRLFGEIPSLDTALHFTTDPLILFQDLNLEEREVKIISLIDGNRTIREVFDGSELDAFSTLKFLHFLLSIGMAEAGKEWTEETTVQQPAAEVAKEAFEKISPSDEMEKQESRQKIFQAFEALKDQNYYQILEINPGATNAEIKKAYFKLAKEYHPDRHFSSGMEDLKEKLDILFHQITQAYETLLDEEKRREYDFKIVVRKVGGRQQEPEQAKTSPEGRAQLGQQAFKKGDFRTAAFYFDLAIKAAPNKGSYHALLAQTLAQIPGRARDAEIHYKRAIQLDPSQASYYIGLGLLYKKGQLLERAIRQFEEALMWDPDNRRAQEEIRNLKT